MSSNTLKFILIIALFFLPTGMPDDFIIIPQIIHEIGFQNYILLSVIIIYLLYTNIEGKTIKDKVRVIRKEIKSLVS